jgi:hypothetical protein
MLTTVADRSHPPENRSRSFQMEMTLISISLSAHDFSGKPVPTFPDRAPNTPGKAWPTD